MPAQTLTLKSGFALLDVKAGRAKVRAALKKNQKINVVIRGTLSTAWSRDDGISQEFQIDVTSLKAVSL